MENCCMLGLVHLQGYFGSSQAVRWRAPIANFDNFVSAFDSFKNDYKIVRQSQVIYLFCYNRIAGVIDSIVFIIISMSQQSPKPEGQEQLPAEPQIEPAAEGQAEPKEQPMSAEEQQTYNKMMSTLSKMNKKIQSAKLKLNEQHITHGKSKTDEITNKLIQSKQSSEIVTKQNLLTDITQSYEKVVIEVYSQNAKLKKKIEQMGKMIRQQSNKIYDHTHRQSNLIKQNEQLRAQIAKMKDERMMMARGLPSNHNQVSSNQSPTKKKASNATQNNPPNQDFDFWSMPQNDYGKKKKDFVQDSNLWVNQKQVHESVFLTQDQPTSLKRKK